MWLNSKGTKCEIGIEKGKGYLARFERCFLRQ